MIREFMELEVIRRAIVLNLYSKHSPSNSEDWRQIDLAIIELVRGMLEAQSKLLSSMAEHMPDEIPEEDARTISETSIAVVSAAAVLNCFCEVIESHPRDKTAHLFYDRVMKEMQSQTFNMMAKALKKKKPDSDGSSEAQH